MQEGRIQKAVASIVSARIVYAINWLNVGAIFFLIGHDLNSNVGGLAVLTASFYLGIGTMQIPSGILAASIGPKKVIAVGIMLFSAASLLSSLATSIALLSILRFLVGTGMAFVFAPGVILIARLLTRGKSGLGVGVMNSAFNVGGLFGLFGWVVLATYTGWRLSLALSGFLGILTGILVILWVPDDQNGLSARIEFSHLKRIMKDRQLILLGVGAFGVSVGNLVISSFTSYYLVQEFSLAPALAGAVTAMIVAIPIYTAIWGGRLYDITKRPRRLLLYSLTGTAIAIGLYTLHSVIAALAGSILGGVSAGVGFTVAFAAGRDVNPAPKDYDPLAVGWVNSVSLTSAFWPPLLFSFLFGVSGYPLAWLGCAAVTAATMVPVAFLKEPVT